MGWIFIKFETLFEHLLQRDSNQSTYNENAVGLVIETQKTQNLITLYYNPNPQTGKRGSCRRDIVCDKKTRRF